MITQQIFTEDDYKKLREAVYWLGEAQYGLNTGIEIRLVQDYVASATILLENVCPLRKE